MSELGRYAEKRDFTRTGEPPPGESRRQGPLTFVVQKHNARRLHYDLRLEVDGVLKSWAVPKGPSTDPNQKRLAAMVEDHPLDYASFEGTIPKGEYGAGEVVVWDYGTYSPDEGPLLFNDREQAQAEMRQGLANGKISILLRGQKLKGSWALVELKGKDKNWLLIKHKDQFANSREDVLANGRSVVSGTTTEDIKAGVPPTSPPAQPSDLDHLEGARHAAFPGFVLPMLASTAGGPFSNPAWLFEPKLDGYRIITTVKAGKASLWSRSGLNASEKYPFLIPALEAMPVSEAVFDGEIVAFDDSGRISFESLQGYLQSNRQGVPPPLVYYVFDILHLDGYDLTGVRLVERKSILKGVLDQGTVVRLVEFFEADGKTLFDAAIKNGLEGVIAKRIDSRYQPGRRSADWLKVKAMQTGDFIIGGYTAGEGSRENSLGALLLGYLDDNDRLNYAGHVGSGFDEVTLAATKERLDRIRTPSSPFPETPQTNATPTWVRPELVAEVKYAQWTRDGRLRIPTFLRLREDKPASEARRVETVLPPEADPGPTQEEMIAHLIQQLETQKDSFPVQVGDIRVDLGNVNKELWPATKTHPAITKRQFLIYLASVSPFLLPHLKDRPLTLSRYPDGIHGEHFWQKHWNFDVPGFVSTVNIADEMGKKSEYIVCNGLSTLIWLGQAADIEFHTWYSRVVPEPGSADQDSVDRILDYPDFIVLDIDPYIYSGSENPGDEPQLNRSAFKKACEVARWVKEITDTLSLKAFVKTSGKTGLHIYLPIMRNLDYRAARRSAETIGQYLMQRHPSEITMDWATEKRRGKVFIDYAQNVRGKTLASAYSPRPNDEAGVSFPVRWDELDKIYPTDFTIQTVPQLVKQRGDAWAGMLDARKDLTKVLGLG